MKLFRFFIWSIRLIFICLYFLLVRRDKKEFILSVTQHLVKKNILYVKFFQAICLNQNLFDESIQSELIKYTDSVPYTEEDIDYDSIMDLAFDADLEYRFFDNVIPFKSGMMSLVFKMKTKKTGETVIVKMKRNNIDAKLNDAIEELKWIIYLFSFLPQVNNLDASTILNKNIDNLKEQSDFKNEVNNMIEAKNICAHLDYVQIPIVYPEITNKYNNIILMEYIPGITMSELKEEDYIPFAKLVSKYGIVSLAKGAAHGDLHPGNLLFIRDGEDKYRIGVLDFGVVIRLSEKTRDIFFNTIQIFCKTTGSEIAEGIMNILLEPTENLKKLEPFYYDELKKELADIMDITFKAIKDENQQMKLFEFLVALNKYLTDHNFKKYGLHISDDFCKLQMSIGMSQDISLKLCKGEYMNVCNDVVNEMFHLDFFRD